MKRPVAATGSTGEHEGTAGKPRRTFVREVPASTPEVRPEDVIPPQFPDEDGVSDREAELRKKQLDMELDEGLDDTFPASDPPSVVTPSRPPRKK